MIYRGELVEEQGEGCADRESEDVDEEEFEDGRWRGLFVLPGDESMGEKSGDGGEDAGHYESELSLVGASEDEVGAERVDEKIKKSDEDTDEEKDSRAVFVKRIGHAYNYIIALRCYNGCMIFGKKQNGGTSIEGDFGYLNENDIYLDSACQSLRPKVVIDELNRYYHEFNSCGERVKYRWGREVDEKIAEIRAGVLKLLKLPTRDYFVSFTLNTTYGINLVLAQLKIGRIKKVVTSEIEHNSVFLATMVAAKKHGIEREVLKREEDGSVDLGKVDLRDALVVLNATSNIDGRCLANLKELVAKVHDAGGLVVVDAAQTMAHHYGLLEKVEADVICFSAHKMYSSSLGVIVVKKTMLEDLELGFIGGGMVDDVTKDEYKLSYGSENHVHTALEPGLQLFGEIVALGAALQWLQGKKYDQIGEYGERLFEFLKSKESVNVVNITSSATISFWTEKLDSHRLAMALSTEGIMTRSGYFCCHYYLEHVKHYPPLLRLSVGYHNRQSDIEKTIKILERVV